MRRSFYENYGDWFPRPYCERHREDFVRTQMAVFEGGDAWVPGECCANQHKSNKTLKKHQKKNSNKKQQKQRDSRQNPPVHKIIVELQHAQLGVLQDCKANVHRNVHLNLEIQSEQIC